MTNIAFRLEEVFLGFNRVFIFMRDQLKPVTIRQIWSYNFDLQGELDNKNIDRKIFDVGDDLDLLCEQIRSSRKMKETQKPPALNKVEYFYDFVRPENFGNFALSGGGIHFVSHISITADKCGELGFLGHALEVDFPEFACPVEKTNDLIEELECVLSILDSDCLDIGLKIRIKRKVDAVIWCLQHPESGSLQNAYEALGAATLNAYQMEKLCPSEGGSEQAKVITERLLSAVKTVGTWVSAADGAMKLVHGVRAMLGS
ncbi:hypothetical protein NQF87_07420 [Bombella sp. TMW 2.2559]|uniref:Uncharacterized protein n=1 Tax=Bombella dulcis TaxID=2967339 RepID=A0ABT3WG95_9PROT|nr:hypothetical protein [Bombella dulcis]MCX5616799.1 hypothetical protein [Bombella dulcis]